MIQFSWSGKGHPRWEALIRFLYDLMKTRKVVVKYVVHRNLPFNMVEDTGFEQFSHQTCQCGIIKHYKNDKKK